MKNTVVVLLALILVGFITSVGGETILPDQIKDGKLVYKGENAVKMKERQQLIKDRITLCEYAESKFERVFCYLEAKSILRAKDLQAPLNTSKEGLKEQLIKIVDEYKKELKIKS